MPPAGWTLVEDRGAPREGTFTFYAAKAETSKGLFTSAGAFAISTWQSADATKAPPEDLLRGFVDGLVTEYASRFGGDPKVSTHVVEKVRDLRYLGWSTVFDISGKGGTFRFGWADLRPGGRFVEVACQGTPENWSDLSPICTKVFESLSIGS